MTIVVEVETTYAGTSFTITSFNGTWFGIDDGGGGGGGGSGDGDGDYGRVIIGKLPVLYQ